MHLFESICANTYFVWTERLDTMIGTAMARANPVNTLLAAMPHRADLSPNRMFLVNHSQALHVTICAYGRNNKMNIQLN